MELLDYFRDLYRIKNLGKLQFKITDNLLIQRKEGSYYVIVNEDNNIFISTNFKNYPTQGYLNKHSNNIIDKKSSKYVVLTNEGLLYFKDLNNPPKKVISLTGSEIRKIEVNQFHCFELKTSKGKIYIFENRNKKENDLWIKQIKFYIK